jgi:hypothetical protein
LDGIVSQVAALAAFLICGPLQSQKRKPAA